MLLRAVADAPSPANSACAAFFRDHVVPAAEDPHSDRPILAAVKAVTPAFRQFAPSSSVHLVPLFKGSVAVYLYHLPEDRCRSAGDSVLRLSSLPELSSLWLHRALETNAVNMQAALQMVVSCFPPVAVSSPALAVPGEQELLLKLLRRQPRTEDDAADNQCSTALVTQLAVAVVRYCPDQLQPQARFLCELAADAPIQFHHGREAH